MDEEVDEFGVPIKSQQQDVDEFGVPVKKKDHTGKDSPIPSEPHTQPSLSSGERDRIQKLTTLAVGGDESALAELEQIKKSRESKPKQGVGLAEYNPDSLIQSNQPKQPDFKTELDKALDMENNAKIWRQQAVEDLSATPPQTKDVKSAIAKVKTAPDLEQAGQAEIEMNEAVDDVMNTYLSKEFNKGSETQPQKYSEWNALKEKRDKGELNTAQMRRYRELVQEAQQDLNYPAEAQMRALSTEYDFGGYFAKLSNLNKSDEYTNLIEAQKKIEQQGENPQTVAEYNSALTNYNSKLDAITQSTGVTPEIADEYNMLDASRVDVWDLNRAVNKQFKPLQDKEENIKRKQETLDDFTQFLNRTNPTGAAVFQLAKGAAQAVFSGVKDVASLPRTLGSSEYGITDEWASNVESLLMRTEALNPTEEQSAALPSYLKFSQTLGNAAGSMAMMMTGGGAASSIAKGLNATAKGISRASNTGTFLTTYMMQADSNLQEGLDAGLTFADAARNAHINSALSAMVEMIVPEGAQASLSFKSLVKGGLSAPKAFVKVVGDYGGGMLKEAGEEGLEQLTGDIARTLESSSYETFDAKSYTDSMLAGAVLGGGMKVAGTHTPQKEAFMRDVAENPSVVTVDMIEETDPVTEEVTDFGRAAQLSTTLTELKQSEQFTALDTVKQNHVLAIQDQITSLENLENPTQQESDSIKNLSKQRETLLSLEAQGINPAYIGIETVPAKVNTEQGEANLFVNNQGDYEVDYGNGRSVIVESGDNAPRELSELGLRAADGEFVGGMPMNRNEVLSPVVEQGTQVNYQGKPARIQRVTEKNGNIVSATLATEDGNAIQVTEGQKGDAEEFLSNLNATNKQEAKNVLDVKGRGQDGSLILNPLSKEEVKIKEALGEPILSDKDVDKMIEEGKVIEDCPPKGKIKAEHGLSTGFMAGGKWTIVQEFKGKSHEQGGIDIEVSGGNVKYTDKEGKFKAKNGGFFNVLGDIGKFMVDRGLGELAPNVIKNDSYDTKFFGNLSSRWEGFDSQSPLAKLSSAIRKDEEGEGMTLEQQELYNKSVGIAKPITGAIEGVLGTAMPVLGAGFAGVNAVNKNDGIQQPIPTMGAQQISTQDAMAAQAQNAFGQQQGQTMNTSTLPQNIVNVNGMNYQYNQLTGTFDIMQ